jgi:hypothetical protein
MAYNYHKKPVAEHVYADATVWQCTSCNCWSRLEFTLTDDPMCPLCNSQMTQQLKNVRVE